jgi:hypothetical protein
MAFKKTLALIVMMAISIVLGNFIGRICDPAGSLAWLNFKINFGFDPATFDINVLSLTLGFTMDINIAQIILMILAVILYPKVVKMLSA